ncbi:VIT1/CCC1 transporter family protein [Patescibacteria group bacterium]|nr:VIT1/CCC1 transporter family protein [Patescibacteria group bacterium]
MSQINNIKLNDKLLSIVIRAQKNEITEYCIYNKLAIVSRHAKNKKILTHIAEDEIKHYDFWKKFTNKDVKPFRFKVFKYYWAARIFGLTFGVRLMEKGEILAQAHYDELGKSIPGLKKVIEDEEKHEQALIDILNEQKLKYIGSIVLGLNDALVELTGVLAGLTLALQSTNLVALAGLVTGISASFSMAASEYLSVRHDEENSNKHPLLSALYTGIAYMITVVLLITPFFLAVNYYIALGFTFFNAVLIILVFNFYVSVARNIDFRERFWEMLFISLGVSVFSFGVGYLARLILDVDV